MRKKVATSMKFSETSDIEDVRTVLAKQVPILHTFAANQGRTIVGGLQVMFGHDSEDFMQGMYTAVMSGFCYKSPRIARRKYLRR